MGVLAGGLFQVPVQAMNHTSSKVVANALFSATSAAFALRPLRSKSFDIAATSKRL
jgi:hypothetical protein